MRSVCAECKRLLCEKSKEFVWVFPFGYNLQMIITVILQRDAGNKGPLVAGKEEHQ